MPVRSTGNREHSSSTLARCVLAFPRRLTEDVLLVMRALPPASFEPVGDRVVVAAGEQLQLPYRVYFPEPKPDAIAVLTPEQRLILAALLTRHHHGLVRERWVRQLAASLEPWVPPFVIQLLGEYVIEVVKAIQQTLVMDRRVYTTFVQENTEFCDKTCARMVSYWHVYYRRRVVAGAPLFMKFVDYPAYHLANELGVWRGRTPRDRRR